jgi:rhamnose utilization protein RhaD (predicted bifunctional aldolase and dehydrogenase)/NAD(P)-dependent dehydrogenase (short-subunit alcohol dehydrogenase family)
MESFWSDEKAAAYVEQYARKWGEDLARRTYLTHLLGTNENLVLHGGGNTSVKTFHENILGEKIAVLFVKPSGHDMASLRPDGYAGLDLEYLKKLRDLPDLSDEDMLNEFQTHQIRAQSAAPSIETLVHAFLPKKFIDHTHADSILALTNQTDGRSLVEAALGPGVLVLDYVKPGFKLAKAAAAAFESNPDSRAMIWMHHGLICWGDAPRESYETTVELITRAEDFLARRAKPCLTPRITTTTEQAEERLARIAPIVRGVLSRPSGDADRPYLRCILQSLTDRGTLGLVDSEQGKELALSPPLTADHLIRTKPLPLWIDHPEFSDPDAFKKQFVGAVSEYGANYEAYLERNASRLPPGVSRMDSLPRVILLPGLGAICAGRSARAAAVVRDITAHTLQAKVQIASMGRYRTIPEADLFDMEYRSLQQAKLGMHEEPPLARTVALVTGAAGAIGSGVAHELLAQGCHVALSDVDGASLSPLVSELQESYGGRVVGLELDVTSPSSVSRCFQSIIRAWGGVDLVIANAGMAMVSPITSLDLEGFRKLEKVNVEGTLLVLAEAGRHFRLQGTGGDIILISTKNVFAPGAKFGAYSATKAAAHQLARIASQEMADIGVRVNMVAPDAVFSHGARKSGLWAAVGPDRMAARGLSPQELEEYYRNRNLLKARVTARHVANAIIFFATRQTPTTGATIPVDGGLPDATPR